MRTAELASLAHMGYDERTQEWDGKCPICESHCLFLRPGNGMSHLFCQSGCNALEVAYFYGLGVEALVTGRTFLHNALILGICNRARAAGLKLNEQDKQKEMQCYSRYIKATAAEIA
jgi:hypothetical protein